MYHPLVYMTAKCNNGPSCKNRCRFCAFYHTEAERIESEKNREELLRKLNRTKAAKRPSTPPAQTSTSTTKWSSENMNLAGARDISNEIKQKSTKVGSEKSPRLVTDKLDTTLDEVRLPFLHIKKVLTNISRIKDY